MPGEGLSLLANHSVLCVSRIKTTTLCVSYAWNSLFNDPDLYIVVVLSFDHLCLTTLSSVYLCLGRVLSFFKVSISMQNLVVANLCE